MTIHDTYYVAVPGHVPANPRKVCRGSQRAEIYAGAIGAMSPVCEWLGSRRERVTVYRRMDRACDRAGNFMRHRCRLIRILSYRVESNWIAAETPLRIMTAWRAHWQASRTWIPSEQETPGEEQTLWIS
jgi:hypothetical protein